MKKYVIATFLMIFPQLVFGWGQDGHRIVALVGSKLAFKGTQFWNANAQNMVQLTSVPDLKWKVGSLNRPETVTHFFQADSYFKDPSQFSQIPHDFLEAGKLVGAQNAINFGSTPWRVNQFYNLALQALKKHDFKTALIMAGVMSHYIGDISQPLHVTENFDGQMTSNKGIHKFFETTIIAPHATALISPVTASAEALLKNPNFQKQFNGKVVDEIFNESFRSYSMKDKLIQTDLKLGRTEEGAKQQLILASGRLADGAATLAVILSQLWAESGLNDAGATGQFTPPEWVKPDYYPTSLYEEIEYRVFELQSDDDCAL